MLEKLYDCPKSCILHMRQGSSSQLLLVLFSKPSRLELLTLNTPYLEIVVSQKRQNIINVRVHPTSLVHVVFQEIESPWILRLLLNCQED